MCLFSWVTQTNYWRCAVVSGNSWLAELLWLICFWPQHINKSVLFTPDPFITILTLRMDYCKHYICKLKVQVNKLTIDGCCFTISVLIAQLSTELFRLLQLLCTFGFALWMQHFGIQCKILLLSQQGQTLISLLSSPRCCLRKTGWHFSHPTLLMKSSNDTETEIGSPWAQMTVWMAGYDCTTGMKKAYSNPRGPRYGVRALLYYSNAMQLKYPGKCHQMALMGFLEHRITPHRDGC